jgi:hypothetical protein
MQRGWRRPPRRRICCWLRRWPASGRCCRLGWCGQSGCQACGEHWSLGIGGEPCCAPEWEHAAWFGQWPDAGWTTAEEAVMFLCKAAERYAEDKPGAKLEDDPTRANRS